MLIPISESDKHRAKGIMYRSGGHHFMLSTTSRSGFAFDKFPVAILAL